MSLFVSEIVTPPAQLPITVAAGEQALAAAVVEETGTGLPCGVPLSRQARRMS